MEAMADLVEAGKIRSVGISNFNNADCRSQLITFDTAYWIVPLKRMASWIPPRNWGSLSSLILHWLQDC